MEFTPRVQPFTVSALGRADLPSDTRPHTVPLYQASSEALVASVSVTTGTAANSDPLGISHQNLTSPVTLARDTANILASDETGGGDLFFDADTTVRLATGLADNGPAWRSGISGSSPVYTSSPCQAYGPVSLLEALTMSPGRH